MQQCRKAPTEKSGGRGLLLLSFGGVVVLLISRRSSSVRTRHPIRRDHSRAGRGLSSRLVGAQTTT
jgi:hypothetical protein